MGSLSPMCYLVPLLILCTIVAGYDEANCEKRSRKLYYTSICDLPLGATLDEYDNETAVSLNLTKCDKDADHKGRDVFYGIMVSLLAALSFGSMFVPIKRFNTGDGMYFQWMMGIGAWLVGLMINIFILKQPPFFSLSMVSGILWATGNIFAVPSFSLIGIGIGQTMQGNINMIGGWISGRFILCSHIGNHIANTVGVVLVIIGTILLSLVKSDGKKKTRKQLCPCIKLGGERKPLLQDDGMSYVSGDVNTDKENDIKNKEKGDSAVTQHQENEPDNFLKKYQSKLIGKVIGLSLASCSGLFLAFQFLPVEFLRRCQHEAFSCNELDYAFGLFTGILLTSTFWFVLYCFCLKLKPKINPKLTVPALFSGVLFGIGNAAWLLSNEFVGLPISFPIITAGASMVSCVWGIVVFREITGWKNLGFFLFSFFFILSGIVTVGVSFK